MLFRRAVFAVLMVCLSPIQAGAASDSPPPPDIRNLAEKLAPLIKETPSLQALEARAREENPAPKPRTANSATEKADPPTELERSFSERAGQSLRLFGHSQIGRYKSAPPASGLVQDDMVVGPGDTLRVTFRGQRDDSRPYRVTAEGQLIVADLPPIAASGMTVAGLRRALEEETARHVLNSTVYLSVQDLRQISVTVLGEVNAPGAYTLSPFHTVLDALAAARGVTRNGSLRHVRVMRGGKATVFDFYPLLTSGEMGGGVQLRDGDKIVVSVLGPSLAVSGDVKRPGIFETLPETGALSFHEMLALAGGPVRPGLNRFVKFSLTGWGEEKLQEILPGDTVSFAEGDMLVVTSGEAVRINGVQILGHVRAPGPRALNKAPDMRTLLGRSGGVKDGAYALLGVIDRVNPKTMSSSLIAFSPLLTMQGKENLALRDRDRVLIFAAADIARAMARKTQENKASAAPFSDMPEEDILPEAGQEEMDPLLTEAVVDFLREHAATVTGAVRAEGLFPVAGKVSLQDFLSGAGGLKTTADGSVVEVMLANPDRNGRRYSVDLAKDKPEAILIAARDRVVVTAKPTMAEPLGVVLSGEVARPGTYDLRKGDTLLDLIERAGGLTPTAFPKGAIFLREAERRKQEEKFRAAARELDLAIVNYYMRKEPVDRHGEQIRVAQDIARELRQARGAGRIAVEADPAVLRTQPEMAMLLQPGDRLHVPRRPSSVNVAGEVLSPAALQYRPGQKGADYIRQAGGTTRYADSRRAFVVFPDGSAAPLSAHRLWGGGDTIPAGSTIVVPRDPDPISFLQVTSAISGILSQLVVGSVAIAEIRD